MKQLCARIVTNKEVTPLHYRMALSAPPIARAIRPGQFVMVKCADARVPLLRRPFSLHRVRGDTIEILYKVIGQGTEALSRRSAGESLDIIGPLGNGFTLNRPTGQPENRQTLLIAGGMGVAPLVALAERIRHQVTRSPGHQLKLLVLIGAKTKNALLCGHDFRKLGVAVHIATEDGSLGQKGLVTFLLEDILRTTNDERRTTIYACGPNAMLKEVSRLAGRQGIPCQVSLEEKMACGVGVCLGCPVKVKKSCVRRSSLGDRRSLTNDERRTTNDEYRMVCKDGPVFDADSIVWDS